MRYFIDTEFIEDFTKPLVGKSRHYIDLISIAIVGEDGREYYAISNEFDIDYVWNKYQIKKSPYVSLNTGSGTKEKEYWLRDNVLMPIFYELYLDEYTRKSDAVTLEMFKSDSIWSNDLWAFIHLIKKFGKSNKQIAKEIVDFVDGEWIGTPLRTIQSNTIQFYGFYADYDWVLFCSLYGRMLDLPKGFPMYCRDLKQMYDEYEDSVGGPLKAHQGYPKQSNSHNALDDARWNKKLYDFLQTV